MKLRYILSAFAAGLAVFFLIGAASITYTSYFSNVQVNTNLTTLGVVSAKKAYQSYQSPVTWASTLNLNFDDTVTVRSATLGGNTTFTTSNLATNRTYRLKVIGAATNCTPTFPATWNFLGGAPSIITASKTGMLSLEAFGTTDASVVAVYAESP